MIVTGKTNLAPYFLYTSDRSIINCHSQVIVFERAGLVFCFNLHSSQSLPDYKVGVEVCGEYQIVLDTDWPELGGHGSRDRKASSHTDSFSKGYNGRRTEMMVYLPCRTAAVWKRLGDSKL